MLLDGPAARRRRLHIMALRPLRRRSPSAASQRCRPPLSALLLTAPISISRTLLSACRLALHVRYVMHAVRIPAQ